MKQIISLLLLLPVFCFGQKKDTLKSKWSDATGAKVYKVHNGDTIVYSNWQTSGTQAADGIGKSIGLWATPANHTTSFTISRRDTVPCIMLVCDTLKRPTGMGSSESSGMAYYTEPTVWWKPGFIVTEEITTKDKWSGMDTELKVTYLDRRKKPLDSWIVVWMVKEIN